MSCVFIENEFYFNYCDNKIHRDSTLHYHNLFEIYYLTEGICNYFIDNKLYELRAGDIVIIPCDILHKSNYGTSPHSRYVINCNMSFIPESVTHLLPSMVYIYRIPSIIGKIDSIFEAISKEYSAPDEFTLDVLRSHVASLLLLLARARKTTLAVDTVEDFVEDAIYYITKNYQSKITLSDVARLCSVSSEHLSRTFKKSTGFGFNEYLTLYRMKRAETLLLSDNKYSISDIAFSCGFNDSNYFTDRFKKIYGISPSTLKREGLSAAKSTKKQLV